MVPLTGVALDQGDPKRIFVELVKIAEGSYGDVYKGRDSRSGQQVAYKLIQGILPEERDEVLLEVQILRKSAHPNIIGLIGAWSPRSNELVIALEFCEGGAASDLYGRLKQPVPEPVIKLIIKETLRALSYLHAMPVMHRDIKGGNILLTAAGAVKISAWTNSTDFGISAVLKSTTDKRAELIGTPYWIAPEVAMVNLCGVPYGLKADVWSVGITAIELAETRPPLHGVEVTKAIAEIPKRDAPKLLQRSRWSDPMHNFLAMCLTKDPSKRPGPVVLMSHGWFGQGVASAAELAGYVAQTQGAKAVEKPAEKDVYQLRRRETRSLLGEVAARQRSESNADAMNGSALPRPAFNLADLRAETSPSPPSSPLAFGSPSFYASPVPSLALPSSINQSVASFAPGAIPKSGSSGQLRSPIVRLPIVEATNQSAPAPTSPRGIISPRGLGPAGRTGSPGPAVAMGSPRAHSPHQQTHQQPAAGGQRFIAARPGGDQHPTPNASLPSPKHSLPEPVTDERRQRSAAVSARQQAKP